MVKLRHFPLGIGGHKIHYRDEGGSIVCEWKRLGRRS
jgi:hypothetical protein